MSFNSLTPPLPLPAGQVIDIGGSRLDKFYQDALQRDLIHGREGVGKYVPDIFMFGEGGIELWRDVIALPDWYQTREEIGLLQRHGHEIARHVPHGASLVDLGSGDVGKIQHLLDAIESLQRPVTYYAVDLCRSGVSRGLETLARRKYQHIKLVGLWGTFFDAKAFLDKLGESPRFLVCMGAEIGNDPFEPAVSDLSAWAAVMRPEDRFLINVDSTQDRDKIRRAYHDGGGVVASFIRQGIARTNAVLGHTWFRDGDWVLEGQLWDQPLVHRFVLTAVRDVVCPDAGIAFQKGDVLLSFESHRNTPADLREVFRACPLQELECWKSPDGDVYDFLLARKV